MVVSYEADYRETNESFGTDLNWLSMKRIIHWAVPDETIASLKVSIIDFLHVFEFE